MFLNKFGNYYSESKQIRFLHDEKTKFSLKFYEILENTSPVDKTLPFSVRYCSLKSFASSERNARKFYTFIQTQFFRNFYLSAYYFSLLSVEKNIRHFESKRFISNRRLDQTQCQLAPIFNLCHNRKFEIEKKPTRKSFCRFVATNSSSRTSQV